MTLYMKLAEEFEKQIRLGTILPGDRLPSVRSLSRSRKLSPTTVVQAYITLENKGFVEARPQSGYYARAPLASTAFLEMPPEEVHHGPVKTSDIIASMRKASRDDDVFQFGCAYMSPETFPLGKLSKLVAKNARLKPELMVQMDFPPGNSRLRRQIAKRYNELGCQLKSSDVVLTSGCNEALMLALQTTTKPGDTVLVESPTYFLLLEMLQQMKLNVVEIPCHPESGIDLNEVKKALRKFEIRAGFVVPSFSNPTGSSMPDENKKLLVELFVKNKAWLIEDEVFSDLPFDQKKAKPLRYFDSTGTVISCGGFTKTIGPGLRVGWILPGGKQHEIENAKYLLNGCTPFLLSELIADFLESGSYDRYLRRLRQTLATQVARVSEEVIRSFPKGTQVSNPKGGYVLWVKLPHGMDGVALYEKAARAKINFAPGVIFSASGKFKNYIRISCGTWTEATPKAIAQLGTIASRIT